MRPFLFLFFFPFFSFFSYVLFCSFCCCWEPISRSSFCLFLPTCIPLFSCSNKMGRQDVISTTVDAGTRCLDSRRVDGSESYVEARSSGFCCWTCSRSRIWLVVFLDAGFVMTKPLSTDFGGRLLVIWEAKGEKRQRDWGGCEMLEVGSAGRELCRIQSLPYLTT